MLIRIFKYTKNIYNTLVKVNIQADLENSRSVIRFCANHLLQYKDQSKKVLNNYSCYNDLMNTKYKKVNIKEGEVNGEAFVND